MPNRVTNTGILSKSYNSRGLITHRGSGNALVRSTGGRLYAAVREGHVDKYIAIYTSDDNGFSWNLFWSGNFTNSAFRRVGVAGLNQNGPFLNLCLYEKLDRLQLWHAYYDTSTNKYNTELFNFDLEGDKLTEGAPANNTIPLDSDQFAQKAVYNDHATYLVYTRFSALEVTTVRPTYTTTIEFNSVLSGDYFNIFDATVTSNGLLHMAVLEDATTTYRVRYVRWDHATRTFTTPVTIYDPNATNDFSDMNIVRDGYGTILVTFVEHVGTDAVIRYSMSQDFGATWSAVETITPSAGHSTFTDTPTGETSARLSAIAGLWGFLVTYTRNNASGVPKTFVRHLATSDGDTYTLGAESEIALGQTRSTDKVVGARFFAPPVARLLDITDPGVVRVAYQVGEGNSTTQTDTTPVRFNQELLSESAYPTTLGSELTGYEVDPVGDNEILISATVMAGPTDNIDYYALGATGALTRRYQAAFRKIGTEVRILRYNPSSYATMNDRSAYGAPSEFVTLAVMTPGTYNMPFANRTEGFTEFIERDVRRIHLPPDFHLEREFVLNDGNFLKRTVWTVLYGGNEYELSQVVPNIIDGQICHYSANAYVIGASHDPFSRPILPSET